MEIILYYVLAFIVLCIFYLIFGVFKAYTYHFIETFYRKIFKIPPNRPVSRWTLYLIILVIIFGIPLLFGSIWG